MSKAKNKPAVGHSMAKPCEHCPFRNDLDHGYLRADRITEICESVLRGESFPCHKTTVPSEDDCDREWGPGSEQCAGAEIFAAKQGASSQMSRIAERLGMHVARLDTKAPVCSSHREMLEAHGHEPEEEYEPCSVAEQDCLHPAGYQCGNGVIDCIDGEETIECYECGQLVCANCSTTTKEGRLCRYCSEDEN